MVCVALDPPLFCLGLNRFNCACARRCMCRVDIHMVLVRCTDGFGAVNLRLDRASRWIAEKFPKHEYCRLELHSLAPPLSLQQFERQLYGYRVAEYCVICCLYLRLAIL